LAVYLVTIIGRAARPPPQRAIAPQQTPAAADLRPREHSARQRLAMLPLLQSCRTAGG